MRIFLIIVFLSPFVAFSQQAHTITSQYGLNLYKGNIFIHTQSVRNVSGAEPKGFEFEYTRMKREGWLNKNCECYSRAGIAFTYFDLDNKILGKLFSAHYFIEPSFKITDRFFFSLKGNLGISYLTNPFDSIKNPDNRSYAIHLNPYIVLGAGPSFKLNERFVITANASFHHISNGGLKEPNRGINWTTFSAGIRYSKTKLIVNAKEYRRDSISKKLFVQTGIFFVPKQGYSTKYELRRNYALGALVQLTKPVSKINGLTIGAEAYYNNVESAVQNREKDSRWLIGLHGGNMFLLNKVQFSQQLGFYIRNKTGYLTSLYHRWAVTYNVTKNLAAGFALKAHTDNADFVDARLVWKF